MKKPSEPGENWDALRDKIIGLGEGSIRKSYYPELQQRLAELERFRALLDQSNDTIFLIQLPTQLIVDANESACQQLGYTREELLNQPIDQLGSTELASWLGAQFAPPTGDLAERETFETVLRRHDGETLPIEVTARRVAFQDVDYAVIVARDMTERKQAVEEHLAHLQFLSSMDQVNRAMQGTNDLDQMMSDVLDAVLSIFDCDRAFLQYPCDPEAVTWQSPMERCRPEYPGVLALRLVVPMTEEVAETFRILLKSDGPVKFGPGTEYPLPTDVSERFRFKSFMSMAVHPKVDKPWQFGIHQCSYPRVWTREEERLFQEIGRRLGDALTSLLAFRDLRESEKHAQSLLRLSKKLERALTYEEVLAAAAAEVETIVGYRHLWVHLLTGDKQHFIVLAASGQLSNSDVARAGAAELNIRGDRMLEEIVEAKEIVVVEDARSDARTNKDIVARLGNRTIVNVPIVLFDKHLGSVGMGTFGDEGVRVPTQSEREFLSALASHVAVTLDRIHLLIERQQAEREIVRLNRLYAVLSDINQAIVRTRDQSQLFNAACHIAVEKGQFRLVGVGRVDDRPHTAQLMASAGDRAELLESLLSSGPTATVIQEGRSFLSNDLEHAGLPGPWREIVVQQGYHSLAILPLIVFDRVWGVIQFYSSETAFFDEQEVRLLIELAADLAYAVESLQRDEQRRQAEAAMRQAQKMESIGVLAGGIAHDFNNLLVAMLGQTSLALEQLPAESIARNHIEKAVGAARRAADLTRQLLAYSGRGQFQIAPLNLNTLIQENLHLFEVAIPKNVRLVSDLMAALPFIDGDVGQMQQVVMNLIINAAEAIGPNPGTVSIQTNLYDVTPADDDLSTLSGLALTPGLHVTLSVQDNGSGMDAATLSRVFDPFFTTKVTGRGLGLAAVLGIIRSHQGGLQVESAVGQGTTFTLYFPVSVTQSTGPSPVALDQPAVDDSGLVLVIDDEESVREAVTDILEAAGYSVITALNGEAGLAVYRERQADVRLVLLDLSMPGLSGEATLHQLREINPKAVVLLSSGYHPSEVARRFSDYGSVGFLQKPYDVGTLIREVRRYIEH